MEKKPKNFFSLCLSVCAGSGWWLLPPHTKMPAAAAYRDRERQKFGGWWWLSAACAGDVFFLSFFRGALTSSIDDGFSLKKTEFPCVVVEIQCVHRRRTRGIQQGSSGSFFFFEELRRRHTQYTPPPPSPQQFSPPCRANNNLKVVFIFFLSLARAHYVVSICVNDDNDRTPTTCFSHSGGTSTANQRQSLSLSLYPPRFLTRTHACARTTKSGGGVFSKRKKKFFFCPSSSNFFFSYSGVYSSDSERLDECEWVSNLLIFCVSVSVRNDESWLRLRLRLSE